MSVNQYVGGVLKRIAGAVGDAVPLINNFLTNKEGVGAADANTVYVLKNEIDTLNDSLGGLKFGTDGEGNYGYFGDDGVLIPFKSGAEYSNAIMISTYYHYSNNTTITDITYIINGVKTTVPRITANSFSNDYEGVVITLNNTSLSVNIGDGNGSCLRHVSSTKDISAINFEDILETTIDTATNTPTTINVVF